MAAEGCPERQRPYFGRLSHNSYSYAHRLSHIDRKHSSQSFESTRCTSVNIKSARIESEKLQVNVQIRQDGTQMTHTCTHTSLQTGFEGSSQRI